MMTDDSSWAWGNFGIESTLKETERNITSMKYHLQDKQKNRISASHFRNSPGNSTPPYSGSPPLKQSFHSVNNTPSKYLRDGLSGFSHTSLLTSLMKRIDEQSNTILHLSDVVKLQSEEIENLKLQYCELDNKIKGTTSNINPIVERKLQNIHRELRNDIESLQAQLRTTFASGHDYKYDGTARRFENEISHNLAIQKKMVDDETDAMRREIGTMKNRIKKIETDFDSSTRDTEEMNRRCNTVERNLTTVFDEQSRTSRVTDQRENDINYMKKELHEICSIINHLQCQRHSPHSSGSSLEKKKILPKKDGKSRQRKHKKPTKHTIESDVEEEDFDDSYVTTLLSVSSSGDVSLDSFILDEKKDLRHTGRSKSGILKLDKLLEDTGSENDEFGDDNSDDIFGEFDKLSIKNKDYLLEDFENTDTTHGSFHNDDDLNPLSTTSFHTPQFSDDDFLDTEALI